MKILFKNTTKYDKENRENFTNFHQEKFGKKELRYEILILLAVLYMIIFLTISLKWKALLFFVPIGVLIYFINKYSKSKKKNKSKKQKNKEFTFYFYERHIKIKAKRQFERMTYFEIKKIFETEKNFFLYLDEKHPIILDKDGFEIGTSKEFVEFIKKKCPFKYRNEEEK